VNASGRKHGFRECGRVENRFLVEENEIGVVPFSDASAAREAEALRWH
jgi:hypothetical protein